MRHRCFQLLHLPRLHTRFCIFPHNLASDFPQYMNGNQRGQNNENLIEKEFFKMKTSIVYDLDSTMPVAVGEQVSAETARYCASVLTGIFHENLLAEEIDLEEQITHSTKMAIVLAMPRRRAQRDRDPRLRRGG